MGKMAGNLRKTLNSVDEIDTRARACRGRLSASKKSKTTKK
jgi:hypothetical protein